MTLSTFSISNLAWLIIFNCKATCSILPKPKYIVGRYHVTLVHVNHTYLCRVSGLLSEARFLKYMSFWHIILCNTCYYIEANVKCEYNSVTYEMSISAYLVKVGQDWIKWCNCQINIIWLKTNKKTEYPLVKMLGKSTAWGIKWRQFLILSSYLVYFTIWLS